MSEGMMDLVECVARAIFRKRCEPLVQSTELQAHLLDAHVEKHWRAWIPMAEAAIMAVEEFKRGEDYSPALDDAIQEFIDDKPKDIMK